VHRTRRSKRIRLRLNPRPAEEFASIWRQFGVTGRDCSNNVFVGIF
jgi:hypothetical protein